MTDTERITDKLRKVLALTQSPEEHEAAAAAATLARLLEQYNLSVADLEERGATKPKVGEVAHDLAKANFTWKLDLAEVLAKHYYCYAITDRRLRTVKFVGRPENVGSMQMLYAWCIDQIKALATSERRAHYERTGEHIDPLRWQLNFGIGAAARLGERLDERRKHEADHAGTALTVHHMSEVSDYLEEKYGYRRDGQKTKRTIAWEAEVAAETATKAKLKAEDLDAYYEKYPWERPLTEEERKARAVEQEKADRKWEARAARRKGRAVRGMSDAEYRKIEQAGKANDAGEAAGDRVNLEPFLGQGGKKKEEP